jgi:hypothetical protein
MFTIWRSSLGVVAAIFAMISWFVGAVGQPVGPPAHASTMGSVAHAEGPRAAPTRAAPAARTVPSTAKRPASGPKAPAQQPPSRALHLPILGVYAGPATKGVAGARVFADFSGSAPGATLDFAATQDWAGITGPNWLLDPRVGSSARLEYSLPMFPDGNQYSLAACARGAYNPQWKLTALSLVSHRLADTIVRPGWEFNGTWYHWSAKNDVAGYIGCFRQIVTTMRAVSGQHFAFDWNPSIGANAFPAELAFPGDAYVDYVGVDIYDTSWGHYPSAQPATARAAVWNDDVNGNHGLAFWSHFAATHHKPLAIVEWGVASLRNGHGGEDDPAFIDHMFDFMTNHANNVAYAHYFDWTSDAGDHKLTGATRFPASAAEYRHRSQLLMSGGR